MNGTPTTEQAQQFALMMSAGMPSRHAIGYFVPEGEDISPAQLSQAHDRWLQSENVKRAVVALQGKPWQDLSVEQRIQLAIEKHYSEMAYFLYSNNYAELVGADRSKADTCRQALEAKLAGMAGKMDALSRFYDDLLAGRIKSIRPTLPTV